MRAPDVELPPGEGRCLPQKHCAQATVCARWLAKALPGIPAADWSHDPKFVQGNCPRCLLASEHRKKPAGAGPRVHEAPGWLR